MLLLTSEFHFADCLLDVVFDFETWKLLGNLIPVCGIVSGIVGASICRIFSLASLSSQSGSLISASYVVARSVLRSDLAGS